MMQQYKVQINTTPNMKCNILEFMLNTVCIGKATLASGALFVAEYHLIEGGINNLFVFESVFKRVNATCKIA